MEHFDFLHGRLLWDFPRRERNCRSQNLQQLRRSRARVLVSPALSRSPIHNGFSFYPKRSPKTGSSGLGHIRPDTICVASNKGTSRPTSTCILCSTPKQDNRGHVNQSYVRRPPQQRASMYSLCSAARFPPPSLAAPRRLSSRVCSLPGRSSSSPRFL